MEWRGQKSCVVSFFKFHHNDLLRTWWRHLDVMLR